MVVELKEPGRNPERNTGRSGAMRCPVCSVTLTMSNRQGVEIDYCPQCRGVWLDRGELDKIIERSAVETAAPQRDADPRARYDDEYRDRGGHHGSRGKHGGYGKHGSRRKSWLHDLFD